jgi:hypothetical protein
VGALLAEGEVTPQRRKTGLSEGVGYSDQYSSLAVGPSTVSEHQRIAAWNLGAMEEATHGRVFVSRKTFHIIRINSDFKSFCVLDS